MVRHGLSNTRIYKIFIKMKSRCYNSNDTRYNNYGYRGVRICNEWLNDFMSFHNWSINNGYTDKLSIDRIDVNGNYEPNNCRWVDNFVQNNNKTNNRIVCINGESKTMTQWCKEYELDENILYSRIKRGVEGVDLLIKPKKKHHSLILIYDKDNNEIGRFFTKNEAGKFIGASSRTIFRMYNDGIMYNGYTAIRKEGV